MDDLNRGFAFWIGIVIIGLIIAMAMLYFGFMPETNSSSQVPAPRIPVKFYWIGNLSLTALAGLLFAWKERKLFGLIAGLIAGFTIYYAYFFYLSNRQSILQAELLIPALVPFIVGMLVYKLLVKLFGTGK